MNRSLKDLFFPIQYLETGASVVRSGGGDVQAFYQFFGVSEADLLVPGARFSADLLQKAMAGFVANCPSGETPSLRFMRHFPITANGPLGMLMLTMGTLGEALDVAVLYLPIVAPVFTMQPQELGDNVHIVYDLQYELGSINEFFIELAMLSALSIVPFLAQRPSPIQIHFSHAPVGHPENYTKLPDAVFHFNSPQNKLVISRSDMNIALQSRSNTSAAQFKGALDKQARENDGKPVTQQVKHILKKAMDKRKLLGAEQLATAMLMSMRTLSRRLHDEGTTVPGLLNAVRVDYARILLLDRKKSVAEISDIVGFSDSASFSRAFKRIVGKTPREFRG